MTLKVLNASIPVSFSNVNSSNNTLILGGVTYTLTPGTYNALSLKGHLQDLLGSNYVVDFNSITNKFTFTAITNFTVDKSSTCLKLIGFADGEDTTSTDSVLSSTYPIDLSGDNTIYIDICNLRSSNLSSSVGSVTSIVRSVLMSVPYGSVLFFEDSTDSALVIQEDHISFIHIRLLGEDASTLLDFANTDWQMTLEIGFVPKQSQPTLAHSFQDFYNSYIDRLNGQQ